MRPVGTEISGEEALKGAGTGLDSSWPHLRTHSFSMGRSQGEAIVEVTSQLL